MGVQPISSVDFGMVGSATCKEGMMICGGNS
jgi:hypothetical protein